MAKTRKRTTYQRQNGTAVRHARFSSTPEPRNGERHRASEPSESTVDGSVPGKEKR